MNAARKLRIVDCPQRDGKRIERLVTGDGRFFVFGHDGYGCKPVERLPPSLPSNAATVIARVQSRRSVCGKAAEALSYEESVRWEAEH